MLKFYCFPAWTTCRKAKAWLSDQQAEYEYRDILKQPLEAEELKELAAVGGVTVKALVNPKSTGFKAMNLDLNEIGDEDAAKLINENPKIMIRPLLSDGKKISIGFDFDRFADVVK
jgi:regulatory protein spx